MSFLDALTPGSTKYDLYAKSISLPVTTSTVALNGGDPLIANPGINVATKEVFIGNVEILQVPAIQIPTAAVVNVPTANAAITLQIPARYDAIEINAVFGYRATGAATYSYGLATKALNDQTIFYRPAAATAFPKPGNNLFLEITEITAIGIIVP